MKDNATKYNKHKLIRNIILVIAVSIGAMFLVLSFGDLASIYETFKTTNAKYILLALVVFLAYFILYPTTILILSHARKIKCSKKNIYLVGQIEHFFSGITPFETGGQPFQIYAFNRLGVPASESTGILMLNYIIMLLVCNVYAIYSLFYWSTFSKNIGAHAYYYLIGFVINFFVLIMFLLVGHSKHTLNGLIRLVRFTGKKIKPLKKITEKRSDDIEAYFTSAQEAIKTLWKNPKVFFPTFIVKAVVQFLYYLVPYFVLKSFYPSLGPEYFIYVVAATCFIITTCAWVPTPGSTGGIEFVFTLIFVNLPGITPAICGASMILWRGMTYYFLMILSFIFYLVFERTNRNMFGKFNKVKLRKEDSND